MKVKCFLGVTEHFVKKINLFQTVKLNQLILVQLVFTFLKEKQLVSEKQITAVIRDNDPNIVGETHSMFRTLNLDQIYLPNNRDGNKTEAFDFNNIIKKN